MVLIDVLDEEQMISYEMNKAKQLEEFIKKKRIDITKNNNKEHELDSWVLLVATKFTSGLRNAIKSLALAGFKVKVLGVGQRWSGWRMRMELYKNASLEIYHTSQQSNKPTLIVCMDAYDALCVQDVKEFAKRFKLFNKPVVLSVESNCGGNCVSVDSWFFTNNNLKSKPLPAKRFVNGGLLVGYSDAIASLYDWMLQSGANDDQVGLGRWALAHPNDWLPDMTEELFSNKTFGEDLSNNFAQNSSSLSNNLLQKTEETKTKTKKPFFVHFPGMTWKSTSDAYNRAAQTILKEGAEFVDGGSITESTYIAIMLTSILCLATLFLLMQYPLSARSLAF
jgi:hypothetical protein